MESLRKQDLSPSQIIPFSVVIVAAGSGTRFDSKTPKQFYNLAGKPLFRWALDGFLSMPGLKNIYLVIHANYRNTFKKHLPDTFPIKIIDGGDTRAQSVKNAIQKLSNNDKIVMIHDAARPLIDQKAIYEALKVTNDHGAAALSLPVSETMRKLDDKYAGEVVPRDNVYTIQTPQIFKKNVLTKAYEHPLNVQKFDQLTDETQLVSNSGQHVKLAPGYKENIKITTRQDIILVETILNEQFETLTGQGFDVHAFDQDAIKSGVVLCGIKIPKSKPLKGHSDADVGLHALVDATLGALGLGDIGDHFPPSSDQWKGVDSAVFVEKTMSLMRKQNAFFRNLDITLICEEPKIGPFKDKMKSKIAKLTQLDPQRINIKATTTEGLGFTGRGEGIAAMAQVTLKVEKND